MSSMLSRSGRSNSGGKLVHRIDVPVSEDLFDSVGALATLDGISKAEWIRREVENIVYGRLTLVRRIARPGIELESDENRISG